MTEKSKILVTGASGFVGKAIVSELLTSGNCEIEGVVRNLQKVERDHNLSAIKCFQMDVSDRQITDTAGEIGRTDILIHTAGLAHQFGGVKKEDFWKVNVRGTENICRLAKETGVRHFILISSVAVYGAHGAGEVDENFVCNPEGFYAESKLESEKTAIKICEQNNIRLTILRLATVIGEGDRGNTMRLIRALDKGRFIWIGSGNNKKSLIYKADVGKGILEILEGSEKTGTEILNLTAEPVSMREIVEAISKSLNKTAPRVKISERLVRGIFKLNKTRFSTERIRGAEKVFEKWLSNDIFSGERFYESYNFKADLAIPEALARQVRYYIVQKNKS